MTSVKKPLGITDVVLRDAHQSLFATRLRLDDMLPICEKLDQMGYWSIESWGGATFDSCIRYLGEDPWERLRKLKEVMPNTPQQMLFRGQNILGYRHYADDVVDKFVERASINGIDVFRVFDAMNDPRNLDRAIKAVIKQGKHAQGTLSYTVSPVHDINGWVALGKQIESMGAHSVCIKDMAGLLKPYVAYELVSKLKKELSIPVHLHCHATTGLSTATLLKAIEAGIDNVDTAISSMSMTYGHTATETIVSMLEDTERDTGLDIHKLEDVSSYFREVRKKYAQFEGALKGVDARILVAQVPGGMLTNMESQLKEQGAADRFDDVLKEIPAVRKDLGYIPLVTPTSQIVGTQAVLNVLSGERYKNISKETAGVLKGEYGKAPSAFAADLQKKVLAGEKAITCRPADLLEPEVEKLSVELGNLAKEEGFQLSESAIDDVLTYALFPQVGLKFLKNRNNPSAFEAPPCIEDNQASVSKPTKNVSPTSDSGVYTVTVNGQSYVVEVNEGGDLSAIHAAGSVGAPIVSSPAPSGEVVSAPLAGNIFKVLVVAGQVVQEGDVLIILEAMKMETEIRAHTAGTITSVDVSEGDSVMVGDSLLRL
ncbi:MAG: sodium-extruding oxaloacetate decarboxylase subunit alpha [Gammaproteobacteria bacterium]|nr:sodium-extruding oxaloacetate decarboxylase subunit alpha [Gammaproteobacteria bacterium]